MRKAMFGLLAAAMLASSFASPVEARRPTPVPSFMPARGEAAALALLTDQDRVVNASGEELLDLLAVNMFLSANRATAEGGITLYFLRMEGGQVVSMRTTTFDAEDLRQMRARFPEDAALPGETFLPGDMFVPVDIYLGAARLDPRAGSLRPEGRREEQLFSSAVRIAEGGRGAVVAAYPARSPDSLDGGGFFLPQD